MTITSAWDETSPAGTDAANTADDKIRETRRDTREQFTDGNHDNISINKTTGARHVASDANDEFPIYDPDAITTKWHGFGDSIRNMGGGTRVNHVFEAHGRATGVSTTLVTLITIPLEDDSAYVLFATWVVQREAGRTGILADYVIIQESNLCIRHSGGNALVLQAGAPFGGSGSGDTAIIGTWPHYNFTYAVSGNNVLLRYANLASPPDTTSVSVYARWFRAA